MYYPRCWFQVECNVRYPRWRSFIVFLPFLYQVAPFSLKFINLFGRWQDNVRLIFCGLFCLSQSLFFDVLGSGYKSLVLPHKVSESLQLTLDLPKEVVDNLLHNLQPNDASLEDPKPETEKWNRCLTRDAKDHGRTNVFKRNYASRDGRQATSDGESFIRHSTWKLDRTYPENSSDFFFV